MRYKGRNMLAALVAVLALGAVAATSASAALPEFSKTKGQLTGAPLLNFEHGTYPWNFGERGTFSGEITGASTISNVSMTLKEGGLYSCHNKGSEELAFTGLKGRLGYINKTAKTVGLMFEPAKQPIANCIQNGFER